MWVPARRPPGQVPLAHPWLASRGTLNSTQPSSGLATTLPLGRGTGLKRRKTPMRCCSGSWQGVAPASGGSGMTVRANHNTLTQREENSQLVPIPSDSVAVDFLPLQAPLRP